ncbi:MAG: delta(24)-sterol C-methyltransferase [Saprospiraceae bacterium]|nr:MAG: delta(24)-sterol C-methyltransferase [Saprospiraceae bacterium]
MQNLNQRIQQFYDHSTQLWLDTWGEHMHHGYYGPKGDQRKDRLHAQVDLIHEVLKWGNIQQVYRLLDAGCGVGGSARHLAQLYGAEALGVTLSPVQVERGRQYNVRAGLQERVGIRVQDVMTLQPADGPFDLIWSLESAEHVADKKGLLALFYDLLQPGGKFLMVTWCHRPTPPVLSSSEQALLEKIYRWYHLPPMISIEHFNELATEVGFQQVKTADWSAAVAPFWNAVIRSALSLRSIQGLIRSGLPTIKGAWAMQYMNKGFRKGIIKFGLMQGQKP